MAVLDPYDSLLDAFERHHEYPGNLTTESLPKNTRTGYQDYLETWGKLLFNSTGCRQIWFWEAWVGDYGETDQVPL